MSTPSPLTVGTTSGPVTGLDHGTHAAFLGVPYAAPPVGLDRFRAPAQHAPWTEPLDATSPGPTAPQPTLASAGDPLDLTPYFGTGWERGEDYLTVSVWTPRAERGHDAPVLVIVPGGGLLGGSARSTIYSPLGFVRDDVVVVIVQHRLGIPGFLHLPDAPDDRGLLDVIAALEWLHDNVAVFGGDPDALTLLGESAGAILTAAVLGDDRGSRLVRRAIVQSGTASGSFTSAQATRVTEAVAHTLDVEPTAAALADLPDDQLVDVVGKLGPIDLEVDGVRDPMVGLNPFGLVQERPPLDVVRGAGASPVDLLVGSNAQEGRLYLAPDGSLATTTPGDVEALAARVDPRPTALVHAYRDEDPDASAGDLRALILGDALFTVGTRRLALAHAADDRATTHVYRFDWRSSALDGSLGAAHVVELPFVFGSAVEPGLVGPGTLLGPEPVPADLVRRTHRAWVGFVRDGDPGWAAFTDAERTVHTLDAVDGSALDPRSEVLDAWS